ncbi:hypothetical protein M430DRAFT_192133 [Amorphotheca resinae ATCC 22711]|uniref:Uncharacterized protein n=1 Tax=Amorphotheca resinae ATCC 22711 TaxID=857342 RepID=A0A2T3AQ11_AMORE|nr:hypothetical protein M430DRAFT_192133 [Amorphotheca resinae ATCC 22711]PSS07064.1 hypothetical protein M430DRAFT_192133 [Amorphotheca resinae ATCC 22711]
MPSSVFPESNIIAMANSHNLCPVVCTSTCTSTSTCASTCTFTYIPTCISTCTSAWATALISISVPTSPWLSRGGRLSSRLLC